MSDKSNLILEVKHLKKYFPLSKDLFGKTLTSLKAVDDVSFELEKGKTLGLVGETGAGKTTIIKCINWRPRGSPIRKNRVLNK